MDVEATRALVADPGEMADDRHGAAHRAAVRSGALGVMLLVLSAAVPADLTMRQLIKLEPEGETLLSQGAVGALADPTTRQVLSVYPTFVPKGKLVIVHDKIMVDGEDRRLALSQDGFWLYVDEARLSPLPRNAERLAFVRTDHMAPIPGTDLAVVLKQGDEWPIERGTSSAVVLKLEVGRVRGLESSVEKEVEVPREVVMVPRLQDRSSWDHFRRGFHDANWGYTVHCGSNEVLREPTGARLREDVQTFANPRSLQVSPAVVIEAPTLPATVARRVLYYITADSRQSYAWVRDKPCEADRQDFEKHTLVMADGQSLDVTARANREALEQVMDATGEKTTGQVIVSCDLQYGAFVGLLASNGLPRGHAPFFVALLGRWKGYGDMSKCLRPRDFR